MDNTPKCLHRSVWGPKRYTDDYLKSRALWEIIGSDGTRHVLKTSIKIDSSYYYQSNVYMERYDGEQWHRVAFVPFSEVEEAHKAKGDYHAVLEKNMLDQFILIEQPWG